MIVLLYILKIHLITVYFFIKLFFKQKKQVCFLSRQSNGISLNYKMIMDALDKENIKYKYVIKKVDANINDSVRTQGNYSNTSTFIKSIINNLGSAFSYYISIYTQMRLIASSKVVITDGYNLPVSLLKHKKGTKVIQLWHALGAVKMFGYQVIGNKDGVNPKIAKVLKMHNNYDYVLSGTKSMNKYFSEAFNVPLEKVLDIGTPTIDYLLKNNTSKIKSIYDKYPELKNKINVLYSPTFRNNKINGFHELIKDFNFEKYNLIITFHSKVNDVIDDERIFKIKRSEFLTYDILKVCDYIITDYSALILDSLVINKKVLLYVYDYDTYTKENGLNIDLLQDYPGITKKSAKEIYKALDNYDDRQYKELSKKFKPTVKNSTNKIIKLIKECLDDANN